MKAVIPLAGRGTRLRPHTYVEPKPLVRVAGRPVMSYILDDLVELGVEEVVFITGYMGDVIEGFIREGYPGLTAHFVEQEVRNGTAGAVKLAEPYADEELLIIFVDTLFEADLSLIRTMPGDWAGIIWAKEVEDYQRFGVIVTDEDGFMTRIVEKPDEPVSKLANIGVYYVADHGLLFEGVDEALASEPGPGGEFYLTDAFQHMVDEGARIRTAPVEGWYDCGKPGTLLETNRRLLESGRATEGTDLESVTVRPPVRIEEGVELADCEIGPNVTIEEGARVRDSRVRDAILYGGCRVEDSELRESLVGERARVEGFRGRANVAADSELVP